MTSASDGAQSAGSTARAIASFDRMHPAAITSPADIRVMLDRVRLGGLPLWRGMNRRIDPETATIQEIASDQMVLRTKNFDLAGRGVIFLNFILDDQPYFLWVGFVSSPSPGRLRVAFPSRVYRAERRSRLRRVPEADESHKVALRGDRSGVLEAQIGDRSPEGIGLLLRDSDFLELAGSRVRISLLDGRERGLELHGEVRNKAVAPGRVGWIRVGFNVDRVPRNSELRVERRDTVMASTPAQRIQRRWRVASTSFRLVADRARLALGRRVEPPRIELVDYANDRGEQLRGIVDAWGTSEEPYTAIVIPPAWGRTKETLLPLARTLVAGFRAASSPVVVLRFDGIRKRGESHNDPYCREPGKEHHRFTFSQGVRDIQASIDFLEARLPVRPAKTLLVSFSAASIESRRAVAIDPRVDGWVCVVGAADTQSMMRVISGGVDFVAGADRGEAFGLQEVLGVEVDIDHAARDLLASRLAYLSDARRDFSEIDVPVTWIHGGYDAWMDEERTKDVLSRGNVSNRKLLIVPTGHILKSSREALETFELVTSEAVEIALGRPCPRVLPDLADIAQRQRVERGRIRREWPAGLRGFWRDYLLGGEASLGIELMTQTRPYESLMAAQVESLNLAPSDIVVDLGSGTGSFPRFLRDISRLRGIRVLEVDYVREGLARARRRLEGSDVAQTEFVEADLDATSTKGIPLAARSVDAVLASFFLSYVSAPSLVLREAHRILKPGGRLVISSLRRDADVSRLYTESLAELRERPGRLLDAWEGDHDLEVAARDYLNQASKLLDLEEAGQFQFWDLDELRLLVERAGFLVQSRRRVFGDPPQALLVSAVRL